MRLLNGGTALVSDEVTIGTRPALPVFGPSPPLPVSTPAVLPAIVPTVDLPRPVQVLPDVVVTAAPVTPWWIWLVGALGLWLVLSGRAGRRRMEW